MFQEDLDNFLDEGEFAELVTVAPGTGGAADIQAIFDYEYYQSEIGSAGMEGKMARLTCKTSDTLNFQRGTEILVPSVNKIFTVVTPEPDGTGISEVWLAE